MLVTLEMFQLSGWSNSTAPLNMEPMFATLDVSQLSGWLNAVAPLNMENMFVTLDVSQPEMSALNVATHGTPFMSHCMSVTADTSQDPIVPCVPSAATASAQNSSSASARSSLVANTPGHGPKP